MLNKMVLGAIKSALPSKLKGDFADALDMYEKYGHDMNGIRQAIHDRGASPQQLSGMLNMLNNPKISSKLNAVAPDFVAFVKEQSQALIGENPRGDGSRPVVGTNDVRARLARLR